MAKIKGVTSKYLREEIPLSCTYKFYGRGPMLFLLLEMCQVRQ